MNETLIRASDAARRLGVTVRTLDRWVGTRLPEPVHIKPSNYKYWPAGIIDNIAAQNGEERG
jgi:predicted DNA-binding transcriptional regulator AlpA